MKEILDESKTNYNKYMQILDDYRQAEDKK